jgi:hypothetical protein
MYGGAMGMDMEDDEDGMDEEDGMEDDMEGMEQ